MAVLDKSQQFKTLPNSQRRWNLALGLRMTCVRINAQIGNALTSKVMPTA
jgi:hypothetical protein